MITSLKVYIWDEEIGRLLWDKNRRYLILSTINFY